MPADPVVELSVVDAPQRSRYEALVDATLAGVLEYELTGDRIELIHTQVRRAYEGRGIGSAIVRFAFDDARRRGLRVVVSCPYVESYLARHPADLDVVVGRSRQPGTAAD
jgi:predicted GNAT family acetyltransferase